MKLFTIVLGCLIGASFFISCSTENAAEDTTNQNEDWQPKMYEPSALVAIMRTMYEDNLALKEQIKAGVVPTAVPEHYRNMLTAQATNPDEITDLYYGMAQAYLASYEALTKADSASAIPAYNAVVNNCISCHQNYCLGPIPKIEKLYIKP